MNIFLSFKIGKIIASFAIVHVISCILPNANGEIRLSYRVATAVCLAIVKFSKFNQIDGPFEISPVNDTPCKTLSWNKCGVLGMRQSHGKDIVCKRFKLNECAPPTSNSSVQIEHRKNHGVPRIVNGTDASPNEFPYLLVVVKDTKQWVCGGIILNENYALTAAHCVDNVTQATSYNVVAGNHRIQAIDEGQQLRRVKKVILHEHYVEFTHNNDIALLQLEQPFEFSDIVSSLNLPERNYDATGKLGTVMGWGTLFPDGPIPQQLQKVALTIISWEACKTAFFKIYPHFPMPDTGICAIFPGGGKDTCQGDSGGPLVIKHEYDCDILVGITSFGVRCGDPNFPGVYTPVSHYIDWIESHAV